MVDIGGGTEDIATFLKMSDRYGEQVDCLAQNVIGYGYDSLSEKIVKSITPGSMRRARAFLKKKIDFDCDESLREAVPQEVDFGRLIAARKECRTLFGSCVQKARKKRDDVLQQTVAARLPMHVFVMGGARSVEFYRASIPGFRDFAAPVEVQVILRCCMWLEEEQTVNYSICSSFQIEEHIGRTGLPDSEPVNAF